MRANYHTHTWRCHHAEADERAYIERAIEAGYEILGFSDHTPYPFPADHDSWFRVPVELLENYVTTISNLKKEYEKEITIYLGLEAEYYPAYFGQLQELLRPYPIDYMILGQHYIGNEIGQIYNSQKTYSVKKLKAYCDQVIEAMETGYFTYIAHPDLLNYKGLKRIYQEEMGRVCRKAKELHIPLEINFLGLMEKRNYPCGKFWELAGRYQNDVILGCDAHEARYVWSPKAEALAGKKLVDRYQLHLIDKVELRKPY